MTVGGGAASLSWSVFILRSLKYEGVPFNKISFGLFEKENLIGGNIKWVRWNSPANYDGSFGMTLCATQIALRLWVNASLYLGISDA